MTADILIVDDEDDIRLMISGLLEDEGYTARCASNSDAALAEIKKKKPDLIIQDVWLEGSPLDGLEILEHMQRFDPDLPMIMISGHGTIEMAVQALHNGAYDFIEKPFKSDKFLVLAARAVETVRLKRENKELKRKQSRQHQDHLNGASAKMKQVQQIIERVAPTESRVLITGAPGTGKDIAARILHKKSNRAKGAFVVLNCALMTPERLEQELFGIEENGEVTRRGLLEQADAGTLFLDEVGDLPKETQAKILHLLTNQSFTRIGGKTPRQVTARIIASTNQDLQQKIQSGQFREDLYYRLNVVPLRMPELAERREDIPELVSHFASRICEENGIKPTGFDADATAFLQSYAWKGNIRQLRNVIEWSLIVNNKPDTDVITIDMLPQDIRGGQKNTNDDAAFQTYAELMTKPLREARSDFEAAYLAAQIERFDGNISRTAKFVGMERSALHRKIKSLGIQEQEDEQESAA